jgi:cytochrome P450 enzyme
MSHDTRPQVPALQFDPTAPDLDVDPHPTYARIREQAPLYYWPEARAYVVTRFDDVAQFLRDPRLSPDPTAAGQPAIDDVVSAELRGPMKSSLMRLTVKDHARVRRAVSPALTPRAVERMRPNVQRLVDEALAPFAGRDAIDIAELADFLPLRVIAMMLAIPSQHEAAFRHYGEANIRAVDPRLTMEERGVELEATIPGMRLIRALIAERRSHLGDDLLSTLIRAEAEGNRLTEDEMIGLVSALITAGSETTVHFICFAVKSLLCVPERAAEVRADPSLLRSALEEILRYDTFGKAGLTRYATVDMEIGGTRIERGARVVGMLPAALRDPRAFPDADKYDPRRDNGESLHFGSGIHFCLGAWLARLEGELMIQTLIDRYSDIEPAGEPAYAGHPVLRKIVSFPVHVTKPARAA